MKIYSTVTSERASKSQGGNKSISVLVNVGSEQDAHTILDASVERTETKDKDTYTLFLSGTICDTIEITKGKQQ